MSAHVGSFDELLAFLGAEGASFRHDATAQIVQLSTRDAGGPVFVRWERNLPYVQIVATVIRDVPEERVREVIDALARLNHAVPLPGFGIDLTRRQVYFRATLVGGNEGLPIEVLKRGILAVLSNARDFTPPLARIVAGDPGARVLQFVVDEERARSADSAREAGAFFSE
jgi:hypothetical protein